MQRLHRLPPMRLAEELLLIDSCALQKIIPDELVDEGWIGPRKDELSPNITAMVHHFNNLALLVPTEILAEATSQLRAKVVSTFIKVAEACHQLKNYHSLKAVLAGLQCTPVYRLRKTWKKVSRTRMRSFQELSALMTEEGNCTLYQRELNQHLKNKIPLVPYLGFFLTQIVHLACRQKLWESGWLALTKKSDLTCPIECDSDLSCPNGSHDDPNDDPPGCQSGNGSGCQSGRGNDLSSLSGFSPMVPSYTLRLSNFIPHCQYHSSSPNLASDTPQDLSDSLCSSIGPGSKSKTRYTEPSTPFSHEDDQFCKLEDAALYRYLTKKRVTNHNSQDFESGISISEPSMPDSDQDDEQFCKLEDSERYRNRETISSVNFDEDENHNQGGRPHTYTCISSCSPPALNTISADVHKVIDEYSPPKHLAFGFTDMCSANSMRRSFFNQTGKLKCSHATQVDSVNPKYHHSPKALLHRYQTSSLLCASNIQSREEIRNLIMNYHSNTEMENYMLSYKWEPH